MPSPTPLKATPDEFQNLLTGKSVKLSLENNRELNCSAVLNNEPVILVKDIIVTSPITLSGSFNKHIQFTGNTLTLGITLNGRFKEITFKGESSVGNIFILPDTTVGRITIHEKAQAGSFTISGKINGLKAFGKTRIGSLLVYGETKSITISSDVRTRYFTFHSGSKVENLTLGGIHEHVNILDDSSIKKLTVTETGKTDKLYLIGKINNIELAGNTESIALSSGLESNSLKLKHGLKTNVFHFSGKLSLNEILFTGGQIYSSIIFSKVESEELKISGSETTLGGRMILSSCSFNRLSFINFFCDFKVQLNDLSVLDKKNSYFKLSKCRFNQFELINVNLQNFESFFFLNTDIGDTFIAESCLPSFVTSESSDSPNQYQTKLFFEQVKSAYQKHGNKTEAIIYQAKELNAHYRVLNWNENLWDKLTLWFNKNTTNFGTSWTRGFIALLLTTIPLFTLLLWSTKGAIAVWPWQMTLEDFGTYASQYFDFINPTSYIWKRWDFIYELEGGEIRWGVKLLLLFSKVLIVTIIYQIIQAFRKFGRR